MVETVSSRGQASGAGQSPQLTLVIDEFALDGNPGAGHGSSIGRRITISSPEYLRSDLCLHYFPEGRLELRHLLLRPYGNSDPGGHDGPDAAYHDVLLGYGIADFLAGTLHVDHEAVGFGRDVSEAVTVEPLECLLPNDGVNVASFGNQ